MPLQDPNSLSLVVLSVLDETPADQAQPPLATGIHVRWAPGPDKGFPLKGGYYLFRRLRRAPVDLRCYRPRLTPREINNLIRDPQLVTPLGTISRPNREAFELIAFDPPQKDLAFLLTSIEVLQLSLPAQTQADGLQLRFRMDSFSQGQAEVSVNGFLNDQLVFSKSTTGESGADVVIAGGSGQFDRLDFLQAPAMLYEICIRVASDVPAPTSSAEESLPGNGWQMVPSFTRPLTLPVRHPKYTAAEGAESLQASRSVAAQRIRYQTLEAAFPAGVKTAGNGQVTLKPNSAIAVGSGETGWTEDTTGMLLLPDGVDIALGIMSVLAPDRLVLSRPFTGTDAVTVTYQLQEPPDYAQFFDQVASLFNAASNTREAVTPPVLAEGTIVDGKRVLVRQGSDQITGLNTDWTAEMAGCLIEIGPSQDLPKVFDRREVFKVRAVSGQTLTLDQPYPGPNGTAAYRVFVRSPVNETDGAAPGLEFQPMDLLELASLDPSYAQVLGLYWIDPDVVMGAAYDYIVLADHEGLFTVTDPDGSSEMLSMSEALLWLNDSPDFDGSGVDGWVLLDVRHEGANPLPPPQMQLLRLPSDGARLTIERPDMADSDVGITIDDYPSWATRPVAQRPVMLRLWRCSIGPVFDPLMLEGPYTDLEPRLPTSRQTRTVQPEQWPAAPVDIFDTGLDVGWYAYRANTVDLFGRYSERSEPVPWTESPGTVWPAVHLEDLTPPPPPNGVVAWVLDERDPNLLKDAAYLDWRERNSGIGLRIQWVWPWSHRTQAPDLREFRLYRQSRPLNARPGEIVSVAPDPSSNAHSLVELELQFPDSSAGNYTDAKLQAGNREFAIHSVSSIAPLKLRVVNGGPQKTEPPLTRQPGTVLLPAGHHLHKDLLDPLNWDYLNAVHWEAAGAKDVVAMTDAPGETVLVDSPQNRFVGEKALWNGEVVVLDALPAGRTAADIRPGIDVLGLTSLAPPAYQAFDIQSVDPTGLRIKTAETSGLTQGVDYAWRIGPADAGLQGLAAVWDDATQTLQLEGVIDISNLRPGVDMVYLKTAPGTTPSNLEAFFEIERVDAADRRLRLPRNTQLTNGASYPWQIGTPARLYDIFLPVPNSDGSDDPKVNDWLQASLAEPVVYGAVAVSAADKRTEVPDQRTDRNPSRPGNEGRLSAPSPIFRVHRDPPAAPESYDWPNARLYATRADYHGSSYFTMRWKSPADKQHHRAQVERASDESLFLTHWQMRPAFPKMSRVPPLILDEYQGLLDALAAADADATFEDVSAHYAVLTDGALRAFAGLEPLQDAFAQVSIDPVPHDAEHEDRLGPDDDPATFVADPAVSFFRDQLDGKARFRYFYRVALVDSAQNRGPLGPPSPPVYLYKVVPPKSPILTSIRGGERQIELRWTKGREPDLSAYRIYRTDDPTRADDPRKMERVQQLPVADLDPQQHEASWTDHGLPAGTDFHYRLTALDSEHPPNESPPSKAILGRAVDTLPPQAPEWVSAEWIIRDPLTGTDSPWPESVSPSPGYTAVLRLILNSEAASVIIFRKNEAVPLWHTAALQRGDGSAPQWVFYDLDSDPQRSTSYRAVAANSSDIRSPYSDQISVRPRVTL